ncbi:MAG: metallophosphoesterase [Pirellulales bacterium]|nr:metallophosphoesterase [Pirellulales bacterium]
MSHSTLPNEFADRPLRLIHASDLHLEQPPYGIVDIPDHLRGRLIDCPYASAEGVFEAAMIEAVDAVILSGDVVDLDLAGPRAIIFLREQFARLAEKNIPIFWIGGSCDPPSDWPASIPLPENVHRFPIGRVESHQLIRDGRPVARIVGTSFGHSDTVPLDRLHRDLEGLRTIGIAYGALDQSSAQRSRVDYLAMGGCHDRKTFSFDQQTVHYPGTIQGRSPAETGRHGCTLVEFEPDGPITLKALATEVLRWTTERIETDASASVASMEATLFERMQALIAKCGGDDLFVTWRLAGSSPALSELRRTKAEQLVAKLRDHYGQTTPVAWTVEIVVERTAAIPESWYDQQTILGDVLRRIRELQQHPETALNLADYLAPKDRCGSLATLADLSIPGLRQELLEETAALAADLLTPSGTD